MLKLFATIAIAISLICMVRADGDITCNVAWASNGLCQTTFRVWTCQDCQVGYLKPSTTLDEYKIDPNNRKQFLVKPYVMILDPVTGINKKKFLKAQSRAATANDVFFHPLRSLWLLEAAI
ncbi:uncharacterized protein MELLADRAFT_112916 [Melampsora larici-populina 98AG31]|uniref:Secreted protein n=1 Tax=Melampsora larici-populina (strain 98AG31 / pathotype 3-4-7) TaxID=747676 RepID=F4S837_MELLP|nr:uncharacterized protein MELLADRAFT_112916 [Melampsora larici-populina 98AG31]EGF99216.1 hypothetical protein MELLADRAFT_112916 [Melampsora larici-populina 98AG31]